MYPNHVTTRLISFWLGASLVAACGDSNQPDPQPPAELTVTRIEGSFVAPESAHWDAEREVWYVSSFGQSFDLSGQTPDQPAYISRIAADGAVLDQRWITLDAGDVAGLAVLGDKLYAARTPHLLEIDIATKSVATIEIPGAGFLNDVAAGAGAVYVSDTGTNIIHPYVPGQQPEVFSQDAALKGTNGLLVDGAQVLVATLGGFPPNGMGGLFLLDGVGKAKRLGDLVGNFDGVEKLDEGYLVSEFGGKLLHVHLDGSADLIIDVIESGSGLTSTADIGYDPVSGAVIIPDLTGNAVYQLTWPH
jgi:hypothetical protein